jgi:DNA-binding PadR family transcriptional regulator
MISADSRVPLLGDPEKAGRQTRTAFPSATQTAELSSHPEIRLTDLYQSIYITNMTESRIPSFLPLKTQWFHIMLSLAGEEQHGYGIMQEVLQRTTGKVRLWPATLYGSIKRLIEADLIEQSNTRPRPELDDARRRYYRLTLLGHQVLDAECERLQGLVHAIHAKRRMVTE